MELETDPLSTLVDELDELIRLQKIENEKIRNDIARSKNRKHTVENLQKRTSELNYEEIHFNDAMVFREMERRGVILRYIEETHIIEARYGSKVEYFKDAISRLVPHIYVAMLDNKHNCKQLLKSKGYPVSESKLFGWQDTNEALEYAKNVLGYPVVIKPTNGSSGDSVYCNITSDSEFRRIFTEIVQETSLPFIMVEKFASKTDDYRFLVIGDNAISVVRRTPPKVIGDGYSTIAQLVEKENHRRMNPRTNCLCTIKIDDSEGQRCLRHQQVTLDTIPAPGEVIQCRFTSNVSGGGECENAMEQIHPTYFDIAKGILALFPGLSMIAIDLLIEDPSKPATTSSYVVCECCCTTPGLSLHTHPSKGEGYDVITPLVDLIFI
jgi:D-alanine-D-alanine ligase-like ATP-grasp enzyme